jgi:hypothetical protein
MLVSKVLVTVALVGPILLAPSRVSAWHSAGHMTVAKIAYDELKASSPQTLVVAARILAKHPHYGKFLTKDAPPGAALDEWVFLKAATWPDWVRPPKDPTPEQQEIAAKYHHPAWHFINYPFVVPPDEVKEKALQPKPSSDPTQPKNLLDALAFCKATLTGSNASDEDRAVSLCWLLHLLGDMHQPLHCAMLVNAALHAPTWDEGGNLLLVLPPDGNRVTNLHSYWDSLVADDDAAYQHVETVAQTLRKSPSYARQALSELGQGQAEDWAKESLQAAKQFAYDNGTIPIVKGSEDHPPAHVPRLSAAYGKVATDVASRRMALGGYRLADQLKALLKAS